MTILEVQTENRPLKTANSEISRLLCDRIELLEGADKILMAMHYENGSNFSQIAQLTGSTKGNISRRIRNLSKKLLYGQYITCLRNRDIFSIEQVAIARDYYLLNFSIQKIALKRDLSCYRVKQILKLIDVIIRSIKKEIKLPM